MGDVDLGKLVMRPASRLPRIGATIKLDLRVGYLPSAPGIPEGTWGWAVLEKDLSDDTEEIVVGGSAPSAQQAAMLGAAALEMELRRRKP